jgi:hypothetical protein
MNDTPRILQHHWAPYAPMVDAVAALVNNASVLEIGPGPAPFAAASVFVDWQQWPGLQGKPTHVLDINQDPLPFPDQSFDFVYCRHTLEDIYNPLWVCREMARVGRAGYIETPSPIAECCRGVDGGAPVWRGYHHHRWVIWVEDGALTFVAKYPMIEYLNLGEAEAQLVGLLNTDPMFWNTYFFWDGSLSYRVLQHGQGFHIGPHYQQVLLKAAQSSVEQTRQVAARYLRGSHAVALSALA